MRAIRSATRHPLAAPPLAAPLLLLAALWGCQAATTSQVEGGASPAPTLEDVSPASGPTTGGTPVTLGGTGFQDGATVAFGAAAATSVTVISDTQLTAVTPAAAAGTVAVTVANPDGQSDTLAAAFQFTAAPPPPPTLAAVDPLSGPTTGGTPVTLTGTGFQAGATVRFGAAAATGVVVTSATRIGAVTPAVAAGAASVTVTNPDAQAATLPAAFLYVATPPPAPTLASLTPTSGVSVGGTTVTLTGTGFRAGATVRFGSAAATGVVVVSATRLTAVTVTNSDAQSATLPAAFMYAATPPPTLAAVAPSSGTTAGGTTVTLTGTGFRAGATVAFGGAAATAVTVASGTRITAVTPARPAGAVAVTVTNADAQAVTLAAGFLYVPPASQPDCATAPLTGSTIFYVCDCQAGAESGCVAGADGNAGTSPAAPWQTWTKAAGTSGGKFNTAMPAGTTVAFCRGGSWTGVGEAQSTGGRLRNTTCTAASPCTLRDYPAPWGGTLRPKLKLGAGRAFMVLGSYNATSYLYQGFNFWNLEILGNSATGTATAETGFMVAGGVTDVDLCNLEVHHGVGFTLDFVVANTNARFTLRGSSVHDNRGGNIAVVLGSANDLSVVGNTFDLNGQGNNRSHTLYMAGDSQIASCADGSATVNIGAYGPTCTMKRIRLAQNVISRSAWGSGAGCMGVAIVGHDVFDGLVIEDNLIVEPAGTADPGCYGIQFSNGGNESARSTNMVVRRNRIFNVGGNGIAVSGAPGAIIENNLIVGGAGLDNCVAYPEQPADSALRDLVSSDGRVRNNTCYLPAGGGGSYAFTGVNEGTGHVFANNAVVTGPGTSFCLQAPTGSTVATNTCSTTGSGWWASPGLDPASADFRPAGASPLLGAGTAAWAPAADLTGAARGSPPTIGAYER